MDSIRRLPAIVTMDLEDGCKATIRLGIDEAVNRLEVVSVTLDGVVTTDTLRSLQLGRIRAWAQAQPRVRQALEHEGELAFAASKPPDLRLEVPPRRHRGDDFFQDVARLYKLLVAYGNPAPAAALAEANGVESTTTVHGWVREARKRGFIEPARKGSPS